METGLLQWVWENWLLVTWGRHLRTHLQGSRAKNGNMKIFLEVKKNQVLHFAQSYNLSGHRGGIAPIFSLDVLEKMVIWTTFERRLPTDLTWPTKVCPCWLASLPEYQQAVVKCTHRDVFTFHLGGCLDVWHRMVHPWSDATCSRRDDDCCQKWI